MTPLAMRFANDLAQPPAKRTADDQAGIAEMIGSDLHCFEVTAIGKTVGAAMDEENMWGEAATMLPHLFLPSPITWLEMQRENGSRIAWVAEEAGIGFRISMVVDQPGSPLLTMKVCEFAGAGPLAANPILVKPLTKLNADPLEELLASKPKGDSRSLIESGLPLEDRIGGARAKLGLLELEHSLIETSIGRLNEIERFHNHGVVWTILVLDLINTPGLIGMRQHDPHRGLARKLYAARGGSYPLRSWSEVVLKHQTRIAEEGERATGATFHKCLHFVRSHRRHYRSGHVSIIPAHWRGDPALGIKRTRYTVAA